MYKTQKKSPARRPGQCDWRDKGTGALKKAGRWRDGGPRGRAGGHGSAAKTSRSNGTLALTSSTVNGIQIRYSFINTMMRPVITAAVVDDTTTVPAMALQRTRRAATVERSRICCCCYGGRRRSRRCCCFSCSCGDRIGQAVEFAGIRTG